MKRCEAVSGVPVDSISLLLSRRCGGNKTKVKIKIGVFLASLHRAVRLVSQRCKYIHSTVAINDDINDDTAVIS